MNVTNTVFYVGVNDHDIDLFEGQYAVPQGMSYNSYVVKGDKIAVMDSVEERFGNEWLENIAAVLEGAAPDFFIVQHMEPDHSANITRFMEAYPNAQIVASAKAFDMMQGFYGASYEDRRMVVKEGDAIDLGGHELRFVTAPMVHWPEVIMTFDAAEGTLFTADAFGKFGALDTAADENWADEARRYYFGIVGKFGKQVQSVLKKVESLSVERICPLHGPVLSDNLAEYIGLYKTWAAYEAETQGVSIAYCSIYGHTKEAAELLARCLKEAGCPSVEIFDLARDDMSKAVESAFRHSTLVCASSTYNADMFPFMKTFLDHLADHAYQNRRVALMENGTWAPAALRSMKAKFESMKNIELVDLEVSIRSALTDETRLQVEQLAERLA